MGLPPPALFDDTVYAFSALDYDCDYEGFPYFSLAQDSLSPGLNFLGALRVLFISPCTLT